VHHARPANPALAMAEELSAKDRKKLSKKSFALPGKRKYPIPSRRKFAPRVVKRFPSLGKKKK
jgi:hypothetical protein